MMYVCELGREKKDKEDAGGTLLQSIVCELTCMGCFALAASIATPKVRVL